MTSLVFMSRIKEGKQKRAFFAFVRYLTDEGKSVAVINF